MENIKAINRESCNLDTIESWAAWYEGEEGWGSSGGDDDD